MRCRRRRPALAAAGCDLCLPRRTEGGPRGHSPRSLRQRDGRGVASERRVRRPPGPRVGGGAASSARTRAGARGGVGAAENGGHECAGHVPRAGAASSRVTKQRPISLGSWRKLLWRPEGRCPLSDRPGCGAPGATVGRSIRPGGRAAGRSGGLKRPAPAPLPSPGPCARPMGTSSRPPDKVTAGSTCGGRSPSAHARAPVRRRAPLARIHSDTATRALEGDAGGERRPGSQSRARHSRPRPLGPLPRRPLSLQATPLHAAPDVTVSDWPEAGLGDTPH